MAIKTRIDDGGPAFPGRGEDVVTADDTMSSAFDVHWYAEGMSLRDYFAGQALAGLCANSDGWMEEKQIARHAYRYADAMLAARSSAHGDQS